ncbi:MAG: cytochrome b561, partial [Gammaproteobacteria bacterium]
MFNTIDHYGLVTIILHWIMAVTIVGLFSLGYYMVDLTYYDDLYKTLPFVHKSIGILFGIFLIFRLSWKAINITPKLEESLSSWERVAARVAHSGLYGLTILIVISGYLVPTAEGAGIDVFNLFQLPATI